MKWLNFEKVSGQYKVSGNESHLSGNEYEALLKKIWNRYKRQKVDDIMFIQEKVHTTQDEKTTTFDR